MFTHFAETTDRLCHGFLGASFGFLIIISPNHFVSATTLATLLYFIFFLVTVFMAQLFRAITRRLKQYIIASVALSAVIVAMLAVTIQAFVFTDLGLSKEIRIATTFIIVVYSIFLMTTVIINIRGCNSRYRQETIREATT